MKNIKTTGIILTAGLLFASAVHTLAIEGIKLSIQSSNVVLSWPSTNIETYLVQYRSALDLNSPWQTLVDNLSAASDTNLTSFQHSPTNRSLGFYQVVRDGAHLFGITNGMTLSPTNIPGAIEVLP